MGNDWNVLIIFFPGFSADSGEIVGVDFKCPKEPTSCFDCLFSTKGTYIPVTNDDGAQEDFVTFTVTDSNGARITIANESADNVASVYGQFSIPTGTTRPLTIILYDSTNATDTPSDRILDSFIYDPATRNPYCLILPLITSTPEITDCSANDINCISEAIKFKQVSFCDSITPSETPDNYVIKTPFGPMVDTANGAPYQ